MDYLRDRRDLDVGSWATFYGLEERYQGRAMYILTADRRITEE